MVYMEYLVEHVAHVHERISPIPDQDYPPLPLHSACTLPIQTLTDYSLSVIP